MYVWSIKIKQQQLHCTSMPVFIEGQVILCDRGPPVGEQMKKHESNFTAGLWQENKVKVAQKYPLS